MIASISATAFALRAARRASWMALRMTSETAVPSAVSSSSAAFVSGSARKLICVAVADLTSGAVFAADSGGAGLLAGSARRAEALFAAAGPGGAAFLTEADLPFVEVVFAPGTGFAVAVLVINRV